MLFDIRFHLLGLALWMSPSVLGQLIVDPERYFQDFKFESLGRGRPASTAGTSIRVVESGGLCDPQVKQVVGHVDAGAGKRLFFWIFESRSNPSQAANVLWLNGGPGCSSLIGLFTEHGPCRVTTDGSGTMPAEYSWNTDWNMLYVEQPAGTGFSEGEPPNNSPEAAEDLFTALQNLFELYPEYNSNLYIAGQSYAGHYIPNIAKKITDENNAGNNPKIDLKGIAIGNGLTDPEKQFAWYHEMAYNSSTTPQVIDISQYETMKASVEPMVEAVRGCYADDSEACESASVMMGRFFDPVAANGYDWYDLRRNCQEDPSSCPAPEYGSPIAFLNSPEAQEYLNVSTEWSTCSSEIYQRFRHDWFKDSAAHLPDMIINSQLKVLIYAGDQDYITNYLGNRNWTLELDWQYRDEFNAANEEDYIASGKNVGTLRSLNLSEGGQFSFLQIFQAGHNTPADQPVAALQMMRDFIQGSL